MLNSVPLKESRFPPVVTILGYCPPQRKIDRVGSVVTIPDGKTVVVGGLKRGSTSESFSGVPWIEKIPVLRELTSKTSSEDKCTSFFSIHTP